MTVCGDKVFVEVMKVSEVTGVGPDPIGLGSCEKRR